MARTCLVLGGNGFIGSAVMRAAETFGWNATSCGRDDHAKLADTSWDLIINANGNSKKYLADKDPELEFQLSVTSVSDSLNNFTFDRYVFLSTVDVYPDKSNPANNHEEVAIDPSALSAYGNHKWQAEQLVQQHAKDWLIVRMAGFVGQGLKKNPVYDLLTGAPLRVHPESAYQYQDTDLFAGRLFKLLEKCRGQIVNAAGAGTVTIKEIGAMIDADMILEPPKDAPKEHYEIDISRLVSYCEVEDSSDILLQFIKNVQSGALVLS